MSIVESITIIPMNPPQKEIWEDVNEPIEDHGVTLDFQVWKDHLMNMAFDFRSVWLENTPTPYFFPNFINSMKNGYAIRPTFAINNVVYDNPINHYAENYGSIERFVRENPEIIIHYIEYVKDKSSFKIRYTCV